MESFKSILVDIDATALSHPALERAIRLARSSGARLTITDVMTVPAYARRYLPADVEEDMVARRRQQVARIAHAVTDVPTEVRLLVGRPATVLIQEVLRSEHDLLMRSHARDVTASGPQPFGAVDMELLRKCPCPVMLVRHGNMEPHPQIAGAVNASTEEQAERALNTRIVEQTRSAARSCLRSVRASCLRLEWPEKWTPALGSKSVRANQLPWLSAKRTAAFGSALRGGMPRPFCVRSESGQRQSQGQSWGQQGSS